MSKEACEVCGNLTLSKVDGYDICSVCFWKTDGQNEDSSDEWDGKIANLSLTQARRNYKKYGHTYKIACEVCSNFTLSEYGSSNICSRCHWKNDGLKEDPNEGWGSPNKDLSLKQARRNYKKFGASYKVACQVCGNFTITEHGTYDICPVCFWEDDGLYEDADKVWGGPNKGLSLTKARLNYKDFGAYHTDSRKHVRKPKRSELPKNN